MKDMLPLWVTHLECPEAVKVQPEEISAASTDRLLRCLKVKVGKKPAPPRPASAVKTLVEVRAESWQTNEIGWTEVDTVVHCGGDMGGDFIWTLTSVEISSGWTEMRAVWNQGQQASFEGLESIWQSQPFDLLGVDSDNGWSPSTSTFTNGSKVTVSSRPARGRTARMTKPTWSRRTGRTCEGCFGIRS